MDASDRSWMPTEMRAGAATGFVYLLFRSNQHIAELRIFQLPPHALRPAAQDHDAAPTPERSQDVTLAIGSGVEFPVEPRLPNAVGLSAQFCRSRSRRWFNDRCRAVEQRLQTLPQSAAQTSAAATLSREKLFNRKISGRNRGRGQCLLPQLALLRRSGLRLRV